MIALARLYREGKEGLPRDPAAAREWYRKAIAFADNPMVKVELGEMEAEERLARQPRHRRGHRRERIRDGALLVS